MIIEARVRAMGIRDRPTSFRSPWQNGLVERLIGSARRECTNHIIVFNEEHLRRILSKYASYYNEVRTHLSLGKDAPCTRPIERFGDIIAQPILGGLHHRFEFSEARRAVSRSFSTWCTQTASPTTSDRRYCRDRSDAY